MAKAAATKSKARASKSTALVRQPARKASFDDAVSEDKSLATTGDTAVSPGRQYTGEPNFGRDDVLMPRLRLAQGLTPEVVDGQAEIGDYVLTGHDPVQSVTIVPLGFGKGQQYREKDDNTILCSSDDAITGSGEYGTGSKKNPSGNCVRCPMNQWSEGRGGKRVPPKCTFFYSYAAWSDTHQSMVMVDFRKTSINAGKMLNTLVMQHKGLGGFAVEMGAGSQKGPNGAYQVPTIKKATVKQDVLDTAREQFNI